MKKILLISAAAMIMILGCGDDNGTNGDDGDVASVEISANWTALTTSQTRTLTASARDDAGDPVSADITWSSSDESVVAVSGGVLTPAGTGSAAITAEAGGVSSSPCSAFVAEDWIIYSDTEGLRIITPDNERDMAIPETEMAKSSIVWGGNLVAYVAEGPFTESD